MFVCPAIRQGRGGINLSPQPKQAGTRSSRHHASSFIIQGLRIALHTKPHEGTNARSAFSENMPSDVFCQGLSGDVYGVRT